MATLEHTNIFLEDLAEKVHDFSTDNFRVALYPAANEPLPTNSLLGDLTGEISYANLQGTVGTNRDLTVTSSTNASGVYQCTMSDLVLTASATMPAFRYIVVYNEDGAAKADALVGWFDYGSDLVLNAGESLTIDFTSFLFTIT